MYEIKAGDHGFAISTTLSDGGGPLQNLDGATILFKMKPAPESDSDADPFSAAATFDAGTGLTSYVWQSGDTDTPGLYRAEWQVTFLDGSRVTFPADEWDEILIHDSLTEPPPDPPPDP